MSQNTPANKQPLSESGGPSADQAPGRDNYFPAEIKASLITGFWLVLLAAPLMGFKIDPYSRAVTHRWFTLIYVFGGGFALSWLWRLFLRRREISLARAAAGKHSRLEKPSLKAACGRRSIFGGRALAGTAADRRQKTKIAFIILLLGCLVIFPNVVNNFHTIAMFGALLYVTLGLGLNLVVGLSGLLHLGYAAFFAIGAYTYGLLNYHLGWGFWACLPLSALNATLFGLLLGLPVLRLRGDYLAIVTLGFGEIVRLVLTNLAWFTGGSNGINSIPAPGLFGLDFNKLGQNFNYVYCYYLALALVVLTVFMVYRLENSRMGRAWLALREDEIAGRAMGIDLTGSKLAAFALSAIPAGLAGALLAAQNAYINPKMFDFTTSALILSIVVLGGMGSIAGVVLGALALALLPEYLREFSEYRPLVFGALMVAMMVFRPQGLIPKQRPGLADPGAPPTAAGVVNHD